MNAEELFKELGLGDKDMSSAREWVNYKHFSETIPDILTLKEYMDTVYKHAVAIDAKPHQWFSERYMTDRYLLSNVGIDDTYIIKLESKILSICEKYDTLELHIEKFLSLIVSAARKSKLALTKETLLFLNEIYKIN